MRKALLFNLILLLSLKLFAQSSICPNSNISFTSNRSGSIYQWQLKTADTYININDNANYTGTSSNSLQIIAAPSTWYGYQYRCIVDGLASKRFTLTFATTWIGTISPEWENPANWSCGSIPDSSTDVFINSNAPNEPEVNFNQSCRSLNISEGITFNINPNSSLVLTGKMSEPVEDIDDYDFSILDSLPLTYIPLSSIIMENGLSVQEYLEQNDPDFLTLNPFASIPLNINRREKQLDLFRARMLLAGDFLVKDANFNIPPQTGLGYMPGGKQYLAPQHPTAGGCRTDLFYGLDCSGMLYVMTRKAYLPPVVPADYFGVENISFTDKWDNAFKNSEYDSLRMFNKGQLPLNEIKLGDIIIWPNAPHVGICLNNSIYQSYGRFNFPGCQTNHSDPKRGPRILPLNQSWLDEFGAGVYKIFRIEFSIVGKWKITGYVYGDGTDYFNTTMPLCEKDNLITYSANNRVSIDEGATKCDLADPQLVTATYTLNSNGVNINTYVGNEGDDLDDLEIVLLNATTLKLKDPFTNSIITYTRQQ